MNSLFLGFDALGRRIYVNPEERKTHMHVMGSSGSGKSKFLEWLIRGDIINRQGFCLIDPHGTLYDDVVRYCAHHVVNRDIILLNLSEPGGIVGFNPFQRIGIGDLSVQVDARIDATMHAWNVPNTDATPTLARTLRLIFTALIEQNLTLSQARHLIDFEERTVRSFIVNRLHDPLIRQEWQELLQLKRKDWRDETLSAKNRLFRFLTSLTLCRFMGQTPQTLDVGRIMDEGKILLVNLRRSDYLSKENARVFGSLLVNEFFEAAFRRTKDAMGRDPKPYYLYLDEFQNFVSLDLADMLDQVRKFGLYMVLAHQRFGQLDENVAEAALSHCLIKAVFGGLSVPNARRMAEELFIGKLDPKRVKAAIYQTKFWPEYRRDVVYNSVSTRATHHVRGDQSGEGSHMQSSYGQSFSPMDWFAGMEFTGTTVGSSDHRAWSNAEGESSADGYGEADIPIFFPVPVKELSNVQYYSPEEQLIEFTAALKRQFQRHCFIQIHQHDAEPMLVPFVRDYYTPECNQGKYRRMIEAASGAQTPEEVDRLIAERDAELMKLGHDPASSVPLSDREYDPEDFHE